MAFCASCASQQYTPPPRTVIVQPPPPATTERYDYTQKVVTNTSLISDADARTFIEKFNEIYTDKGKSPPVFVMRINPDAAGNPTTPASASDQQVYADIRRYIGRPLREGGVRLVEDVGVKADILLRVLASSRIINMQDFSGQPIQKSVPDVQIEAVRTEDTQIVGQAGSADVIGARQDAWVAVDRVGVPEVYKATALVLLEDMVMRRLEQQVKKVAEVKQRLTEELVTARLPAENTNAVSTAVKESSPAPATNANPTVVLTPVPKSNEPKAPAVVKEGDGDIGKFALRNDKPLVAPLDASKYALNNDQADKVAKVNQDIETLNSQGKEILAWKYALVPQAQATPDATHLVKNVLMANLSAGR